MKPYLFCIDDVDEFGVAVDQTKFFGHDDGSHNRRFDIIFKPCTPQKLTNENKHLKDTKCIANLDSKKDLEGLLQRSIDYLGTPEVKLVYNHERIDTSEKSWGSQSIKKEMKLASKSFSASVPTYFHYHLRRDILIDETQLV